MKVAGGALSKRRPSKMRVGPSSGGPILILGQHVDYGGERLWKEGDNFTGEATVHYMLYKISPIAFPV